MDTSKIAQLSAIISELDANMAAVRDLGLPESALFLGMAKLELQMRIHDISSQELDQLCVSLDDKGTGKPAGKSAGQPRQTRPMGLRRAPEVRTTRAAARLARP